MSSGGWGRGTLMFLLLVFSMVLSVAPVLGGNTATVTGEIAAVPAPVAAFSGSPVSGTSPLTVAFDSSASTGVITGYAWDFDNNGVVDSTDANPSYTYTAAGSYTVKLTVTGPGGTDDEIKTEYITVNAPSTPPVAAFTATPTSGSPPLLVQFTDQSTNSPTSWKWEYKASTGSWTQFSTAQNPSFTFAMAGTYSIRLTATNAAGSDSETKSSYITVGQCGIAIAYFTAKPTSGNRPLTVKFTDKSMGTINNREWDFQNDGTYDSTEKNPSFTYTAKGKYSVKLRVTNACATSTMIRYNYINVK